MNRFLETFQNAQKEYMEKDPEWYKENPKSAEAWAFVRAFKEEPSIATELLVRSIGGQLGGLKDDKLRQ